MQLLSDGDMMAAHVQWNSEEKQQKEQEQPVPPYAKCIANRNFAAREPYDLPFVVGEELTIIEPCNVIFWYLAENSQGKRGVIPITYVKIQNANITRSPSQAPPGPQPTSSHPFLPPKPRTALPHQPPLPPKPSSTNPSTSPKTMSLPQPHRTRPNPVSRTTSAESTPSFHQYATVDDIDSRPPAPLPEAAFQPKKRPTIVRRPGKYRTFAEFSQKSGWFSPTVDNTMVRKLNMQMAVFTTLKHGTYYFVNKVDGTIRYVSRSNNMYRDLLSLIHRLFEKPEHSLSPLEVELKYHYPDAQDWHMGVYPVVEAELVDLEETVAIVRLRTLAPNGLNPELKFHSREHFYAFANWYSAYRKNGNKDNRTHAN